MTMAREIDPHRTQSLDLIAKRGCGEVAHKALGRDGAEVGQRLEGSDIGAHDRVEIRERASERLAGGFAQMAHAQRGEQALQAATACGVGTAHDALGGLGADAGGLGERAILAHFALRRSIGLLEHSQALWIEREDVGEVPDQPRLDELVDDLLAEPIDVHLVAAHEPLETLTELRRAGRVDAVELRALLFHGAPARRA